MFNKWKYLFGTQFLGVFNDNLLKWLICYISVSWVSDMDESLVISIASALMVAPFILFSPLAGKLALSHSKLKIVRIAKLIEMPIMILAIIAFAIEIDGFEKARLGIVLTALFFMGLQSTLFSPSKAGLVRDIGGVKGLSYGLGSMEMLTFVGVLLGTVAAGIISDLESGRILVISSALLLTAFFGWLTSKGIKADEPAIEKDVEGTSNPFKFLRNNFTWAKQIRGLNTTVLGLGTFWLVGALVQMNLVVHCPEVYNLTDTQTSIVIAFVAIGIGLGCYTSGLLARNKVELGIVPIGGLGLSICMSIIAFSELSLSSFVAVLIMASFFSGMYKVPLSAWLQERVVGRKLGDILAYNNLIVFIFILLSAVLFGVIETSFDSTAVFVSVAIISWSITIVTFLKIPAMMVRFIVHILGHSFFKIKLEGSEHIPTKTGALVVANHISLLDALLVVSAVPRMIRFVAHKKVYDHPLLNWWMRKLNVIPIQPRGGKHALEEFNRICQKEINAGHVVCIFPEGEISRTGHLHEFKKGIEHIAKGIDAPIIPLHFDNVVGSPFSYYTGSSALYKLKRSSLKRKVGIKIGQPMKSTSTAFEVRQRMLELAADTFGNRIGENDSLAYYFLKSAIQHPDKMLTTNENGGKVSYRQIGESAIKQANTIEKALEGYEIIGLDVSSNFDKTTFNIAMNMLGKIVVNVDSASEVTNSELEPDLDAIICIRKHSGIYTNNLPMLEVEDIIEKTKRAEEVSMHGMLKKLSENKRSSDGACMIFERRDQNKVAKIVLSNRNVLCNILGLKQVHKIREDDSVLSILPMSTSFGYTTNLWLPLSLGLSVYSFHEKNEFIKEASILVGWEDHIDQIIQYHLSNEALDNVRHVITGHRRLQEDKEIWIEENWNTQIRYGCGMPEASPIISVNNPDFAIPDLSGEDVFHRGNESDTVGRPLPGVAIKIINSMNEDILKEDEFGQVLIKGPNVIHSDQSNYDLHFLDDWLVTPYRGAINQRGFLKLEEAPA